MEYEIREMSFAEVLDTGFQLLRNHFGLLVGTAAIVYLPLAFFIATLEQAGQAPTPDTVEGLGALIGTVVMVALLLLVGTTIVFAAVTHAIGQVYLNRPITRGESLRYCLRRFLPLFGTSILYMLFVTLGFLLFIVPGIFLMLGYMLLWPVMLVEDVFGRRSLRRSRDLMRGRMLRGFGVIAVAWLISTISTQGTAFAFGSVPVLGPLGSGIGQAFAGAYGSAVLVVLYFDARCRREAFDLEHLAAQVSARTTPA